MIQKLLVIIPAYNEEESIGKVVGDLRTVGFEDILVVNDGSWDTTVTVAQKFGAIVISHILNVGLGGAIATGLEYARYQNYNFAITMDADGQHRAEDAVRVKEVLLSHNFDFVIGTRIKDLAKGYKLRYLVNILSNLITYALYGVYVSDSQSGMRGFNRKALELLQPVTSGYEVSTELIGLAKKSNLKIGEIPIKGIYTSYSLKKGQKVTNAFKVLRRLLVS